MNAFEERNNEEKEETHVFGDPDGGGTRMLGCWLGNAEDLRNRIGRASKLWGVVKCRLKHSRLSRRTQARVVEACVESGLLFDCAVRTWYKKDMKKLQSWIDRCYRYVWSNRREPPLRVMERQHQNMQDVRNELGVKSVRYKIEKRVLERVGHVMRMGEERMVKRVVLGWWKELEEWPKAPGKKRKTVLYWKQLLREAGVDWVDVARLAADRAEWREIVGRRMRHVEKWERQRGHSWGGEEGDRVGERNEGGWGEVNPLECRYEGCGKVCKSRAGLAIHMKRMHRRTEESVLFKCDACGVEMGVEANLKNHQKTCGGRRSEREGWAVCEGCGREITKGNIARHRRACTQLRDRREVDDRQRQDGAGARVYVARRRRCEWCGRELSATNMARHLLTCVAARDP